MFRSAVAKFGKFAIRSATTHTLQTQPRATSAALIASRKYSSAVTNLTPEEVEAREQAYDEAWVKFFDNTELDYYDYKLGFEDVFYDDLVPEAPVIQSMLYACRRINNYALAVRTLETLRVKCRDRQDIYEYMIQELQPSMDELGISTPEEMDIAVAKEEGYDAVNNKKWDLSAPRIES